MNKHTSALGQAALALTTVAAFVSVVEWRGSAALRAQPPAKGNTAPAAEF